MSGYGEVNYDVIKLNFSDLELLQIQKRRKINGYTVACAAGGAIIGGIIGANSANKCSGCDPYERLGNGMGIGMLSGGLAGICIYSSVKVNIPLELDKTGKRRIKLI